MYFIDDYYTFYCNTHDPDTGAETDADAVPSYRVYEEETGTPILTGNMSLLDDANTVGGYSEQIQLTAANGFEEGKMYLIRMRAVVGEIAGVKDEAFKVNFALATDEEIADAVKADPPTIGWDEDTVVKANLTQILGTALTETAGQIAAAFKKFFDKASPTGTINSIPDAVAGANGGLPTTNGTKVNQTVDLTAGQSIACSDKTGFSLAATGADLILKSSTFVQAIVAAINELATYGLTALNTLLVTTGIKAASIPNATVGGYASGQDPVTLMNADPPDVNVKTETNHDFTALQKTSLDAATPSTITGSNAVTLTIQAPAGTNIVGAFVDVFDSGNTTFIGRLTTNSSGQVSFSADDGTYIIRIIKAGYVFANQTLVVNGTEAETYTGTAYAPAAPAAASICRVYEYAYDPDGTPMSSIKAYAKINTMPYNANSVLYAGQNVTAEYDPTTGLLYWDLVQASSVKFVIKDLGINTVETIPASSTVRLSDI